MAQDATEAIDEAALEAAAAWRIRLTDAGLATTPAFERWRLADARHSQAWRRVAAAWNLLEDHAGAPAVLEARARAQRHLRQAELGRRRRRLLLRLAAAFAIFSIALAIGAATWLAPARYETGPTARRVVLLSDGSRVALDGGTLLRVKLTEQRRDLELVRGQARFDVAHDASRPFRVRAGGREVVALGTRFTVDILGPSVRVTLLEGRVVVSADSTAGSPLSTRPASSVTLRPGERLLVARAGAGADVQIEKVSKAQATAWESGKLVFEDEPLGTVAARMSRYTVHPIVVVDAQAAALRMSGVFTAGDPVTFLDTVTRYLPVQAHVGQGGRIELQSREGASQ